MLLDEPDFDNLRREFAERLETLIGDKRDPANLQRFHERTGRPVSKLIQWRNPKHRNWPDIRSLMQICYGADVSPSWLLFGRGGQKLSQIKRGGLPTKEAAIEEIITILSDLAEPERRNVRQRITAAANKIAGMSYTEDSDRENVSTVAGDTASQHPERILSLSDRGGPKSRRGGKGR